MRPAHRSGLWAVMLVLALAAVGWQLMRPSDGTNREDHDDGETAAPRLFDSSPSTWTAVEMIDPRRGVTRFERDPAGRWLLHGDAARESAGHTHEADPAAARRIDEVFGMFSRTAIERSFGTVDATRLADYGLDRPQLIVLVRGTEGRPLVTLEAGDVASDGLSRYVRLPRDGEVATVANYQIRGLADLAHSTGTAPAAVSSSR